MITASGLLLTASPAGASTAAAAPVLATSCESFGNQWCIGAPSLGTNDAVTQTTSGRTLIFEQQSGGHYKIGINATDNSNGNPTLCVAATNNDANAVLHSCSGASTLWVVLAGPSGHCLFKNANFGTYLSGDNHGGDQFEMLTRSANGTPGKPGAEQQFTLFGVPGGPVMALSAVTEGSDAATTCS
jgi:hypothetical protein